MVIKLYTVGGVDPRFYVTEISAPDFQVCPKLIIWSNRYFFKAMVDGSAYVEGDVWIAWATMPSTP